MTAIKNPRSNTLMTAATGDWAAVFLSALNVGAKKGRTQRMLKTENSDHFLPQQGHNL